MPVLPLRTCRASPQQAARPLAHAPAHRIIATHPAAGYKIMRILGVKMTRLTNSRGFVGARRPRPAPPAARLHAGCPALLAPRTPPAPAPAPWHPPRLRALAPLPPTSTPRSRDFLGHDRRGLLQARPARQHHALPGRRGDRHRCVACLGRGAGAWGRQRRAGARGARPAQPLAARARPPALLPCTPRPTPTRPTLPKPLSTGLLEGRQGFNWVLLLRFFVGWVATLVVAGVTAGARRGGRRMPRGLWRAAACLPTAHARGQRRLAVPIAMHVPFSSPRSRLHGPRHLLAQQQHRGAALRDRPVSAGGSGAACHRRSRAHAPPASRSRPSHARGSRELAPALPPLPPAAGTSKTRRPRSRRCWPAQACPPMQPSRPRSTPAWQPSRTRCWTSPRRRPCSCRRCWRTRTPRPGCCPATAPGEPPAGGGSCRRHPCGRVAPSWPQQSTRPALVSSPSTPPLSTVPLASNKMPAALSLLLSAPLPRASPLPYIARRCRARMPPPCRPHLALPISIRYSPAPLLLPVPLTCRRSAVAEAGHVRRSCRLPPTRTRVCACAPQFSPSHIDVDACPHGKQACMPTCSDAYQGQHGSSSGAVGSRTSAGVRPAGANGPAPATAPLPLASGLHTTHKLHHRALQIEMPAGCAMQVQFNRAGRRSVLW